MFLLGRISRRTDGVGAALGVIAATVLSLWMTFSKGWPWLAERYRTPFHTLLTIVFCTVVILVIGLLVSLVRKPRVEELRRFVVDTSTTAT